MKKTRQEQQQKKRDAEKPLNNAHEVQMYLCFFFVAFLY